MKLILEKPELGNYRLHSASIMGPDYDDFKAHQSAYFKLEDEVLLFKNCLGIQHGSSINLLNEYDEPIVIIPAGYKPYALYELNSSVWKDLTNEQRTKPDYLEAGDVIQADLRHYFFQYNDETYVHILSDEFRVLDKDEGIFLHGGFGLMSEKFLADEIEGS